MIDRGNLINTPLQYKMTLKYIMRSRCSTSTMRQFVKELKKTWTSKFQDYHNLLWSTLQSASVRELIQKIENHPNRHALQRDLPQSQSFNPFSPESKQMIHEVGNIELCELLDMEPKAQCKVCLSYWDIGIVYCTCGHFLRKGTEENKKFIQYTMDLLSIPDYYIKKGRPHAHRYGKKPGDKEYYIAHQLKKKCKKKYFQGIHDRFVLDEQFRKNILKCVEQKIFVAKWMILRTKIIPTIWLQNKLTITKVIGGFVRTRQVPILCQSGTDLTPNKHCIEEKRRSSTKPTMDNAILLHLGGAGKDHGGLLIPTKVTMETYPVLIDQGNLINK